MKELSPAALRLFELARGQDEPDALARNRVANALSVKIAAEASLVAAGASAPASAAGLGWIAGKSTLAVVVVGALVTAGWLILRTLQPAAPPVPSPPHAALVAKPVLLAHVEEEPLSELPLSDATKEPAKVRVYRKPTSPSRQRESPTPPTAAGAADGLRAETEALRLAQQALRDEMPQQALSLLDEQDLRLRNGQLRQERAAARVLALCQVGRVGEARAQALRFERLWPRSALLGRIRSACWAP